MPAVAERKVGRVDALYKTSNFIFGFYSQPNPRYPNEDRGYYSERSDSIFFLDGSSQSNGEFAANEALVFLDQTITARPPNVRTAEKNVYDALVGVNKHLQHQAAHYSAERREEIEIRAAGLIVQFVWGPKNSYAVIGHVGDIRAYHATTRGVRQLTTDHNLVYASTLPTEEQASIMRIVDEADGEALRKACEDPRIDFAFERRGWLVQTLGYEGRILYDGRDLPFELRGSEKTEPDITVVKIARGHRIAATTDGVHDLAPGSRTRHLIRTSDPTIHPNLGKHIVFDANEYAQLVDETLRNSRDDRSACGLYVL